MSQSNLSGPLYVTDALVVGGTVHATGGINLAGGGTITGDQSVIGNFNVVGTAGVHGATTVHSLVDEGAFTAAGTTGLQATQVASLVDLGALTALGTTGLAAVTSSGLVHAANLSSAGTLGVVGNATLAGTALTVGTQVWSYGTANPGAGGVIGNIRWNTAPSASGEIGWVCTAPGTWKAFGTIAA